jgi:hypothetical protein
MPDANQIERRDSLVIHASLIRSNYPFGDGGQVCFTHVSLISTRLMIHETSRDPMIRCQQFVGRGEVRGVLGVVMNDRRLVVQRGTSIAGRRKGTLRV